MIYCKENVRFPTFRPEMYRLFPILDDLFQKWGYSCVITSANDSSHMGTSAHYDNSAWDLRTKHIENEGIKTAIINELRDTLGPGYTILFEYPGEVQEHLHVMITRLRSNNNDQA